MKFKIGDRVHWPRGVTLHNGTVTGRHEEDKVWVKWDESPSETWIEENSLELIERPKEVPDSHFKITNLRTGEGYRSKFIYCECVRVKNDELVISATLDYVVDNAKHRGYTIVNAQEVLNFLNENGRI